MGEELNLQEIMPQEQMRDDLEEMKQGIGEDSILCHMNKKEVEELSQAQGGLDRNNKWNIPQFNLLGELLDENEEFREGLELGIKGWFNLDESEKDSIESELGNLADKTLGKEKIDLTRSDDNENILAQELAGLGSNGDSQIVLLPMNLFELMWESCPEKYRQINEETGLAEFDFWSFIGKLAGGFIGTLILPGIGTAIGTGLGSIAGEYGDEFNKPEEEKTGFGSKLFNGLLAGGLSGLGSYLGGGASGAGDAAGAAGASAANSAAGSAAASAAGVTASPLKNIISSIGSSFPIGSALTSEILKPLISSSDSESKDSKNSKDSKDVREIRRNELLSHEKKEHQFNPILKLQTSNPEFFNHSDFSFQPRSRFKNGGKIEPIVDHKPIKTSTYIGGDFTGQADNIHVDVPEGCYVFDAQTVSFLGDGNSEAGGKALKEWADKLPSIKSKVNKTIVPCAFSSGEFVLYFDKAEAIGVKTLDKLVKKIREQKGVKTDSIPQEAKDIPDYLPQLKKVG